MEQKSLHECQNNILKFQVSLQTVSYGQSKVYFITWPVQNVTGQLLLLSLSEVGQYLFEANINGAEAFYELKMKLEM